MAKPARTGRTPRIQHLCARVDALKRIFAWAIPKGVWIQMNRPMRRPGDAEEERLRRVEYAAILKGLSHSELIEKCDPDNPTDFPSQILEWQYREALLDTKPSKAFSERQSEYARRLAIFLVAKNADASEQYLQKACRRYDPNSGAQTEFQTPEE